VVVKWRLRRREVPAALAGSSGYAAGKQWENEGRQARENPFSIALRPQSSLIARPAAAFRRLL
jgi:hypothetical protein